MILKGLHSDDITNVAANFIAVFPRKGWLIISNYTTVNLQIYNVINKGSEWVGVWCTQRAKKVSE